MTPASLASLGPDVSRETTDKLIQFVELLMKWNAKINLIGRATEGQIWERHIADSVQLFNLRPSDARSWADLGAGGGLPGVVVAVLLAEADPTCQLHLVESDVRKATFLREAVRILNLNAKVYGERIEKMAPLQANVVSARALAPLADLCKYAALHLAEDGTAIFPKGESWAGEVEAAKRHWAFSVQSVPSITSPNSAVLLLRDIHHV